MSTTYSTRKYINTAADRAIRVPAKTALELAAVANAEREALELAALELAAAANAQREALELAAAAGAQPPAPPVPVNGPDWIVHRNLLESRGKDPLTLDMHNGQKFDLFNHDPEVVGEFMGVTVPLPVPNSAPAWQYGQIVDAVDGLEWQDDLVDPLPDCSLDDHVLLGSPDHGQDAYELQWLPCVSPPGLVPADPRLDRSFLAHQMSPSRATSPSRKRFLADVDDEPLVEDVSGFDNFCPEPPLKCACYGLDPMWSDNLEDDAWATQAFANM
jgi:hypothetical protein